MTMSSLIQKIKGEDNLILKCLIVGGFAFLVVWLTKSLQGSAIVQQMFERIDSLGFWAPILYISVYILMSGIFMPSIVFKVFAGTIFGVAYGILWVSVASTISSFLKFLLARYFFKDSINKKIDSNEKMKKIDQLIEKDGWKMLLLLRNIPVANSMFLNYICGVTKMSSRDFVVASFIGRLPTTFLYVYLGFLVGYSSGIDSANETRITFEWVMLWFGLLASIGLAYYVIYVSKKLVDESLPESNISVKS